MQEIGSGVSINYVCWKPDRELNPQYKDFPDVEKWGISIYHTDKDGNECSGFCTFDGLVQNQISSSAPKWAVLQWEPLTLSPSILCSCGFHGYIKEGKWVNV